MNREQKAQAIDEIAGQIEAAGAVLAVDYRGISVPQVAELRASLRDADTTFRVVKNSLTERAADKAGAAGLKVALEGPTALAFVRGDVALAAKALADYGRRTELLAFKGGLMDGAAIDVDQIGALSRLPAREVLHAQLVGTVAAPLTGLTRGLAQLIAGLASQLGQIAERGLVGAAAPAEQQPAAEEQQPAAEEPEAPSEHAADGDAASTENVENDTTAATAEED